MEDPLIISCLYSLLRDKKQVTVDFQREAGQGRRVGWLDGIGQLDRIPNAMRGRFNCAGPGYMFRYQTGYEVYEEIRFLWAEVEHHSALKKDEHGYHLIINHMPTPE
jgi:hypothetical protein